MNPAMLAQLQIRRSVKPDMMGLPGPDPEQLRTILSVAARVPDHKKLAPWRFIVFEGEARAVMGEEFAKACVAEDKMPPSDIRLAQERGRLLRAPVVVAVISAAREKAPAPEWEQVLSAGAACMNLCHAANALGFATCWITEWVAYSPTVKAAMKLEAHERIAGFVYAGTAREKPDERERPDMAKVVTRWGE